MRRRTFLYGGAAASVALPGWAQAQASQVSPGIDLASKTVTVGAFTPITGPVPFYSILTHAADACFKWASDSNAPSATVAPIARSTGVVEKASTPKVITVVATHRASAWRVRSRWASFAPAFSRKSA